ncbi:MAG: response regulator [Pseudomonadota bacterium]
MPTAHDAPNPLSPDDEPKHVLVVDDDDRIRALLKKFLSEAGFRVSAAGDAAEARERLKALVFDLLVVDVMMPGENGIDLTRSLRGISNVPILILTARGLPEDRIDGLEAGADDYLGKPFEPRELLLRINALLRRSAARPAPKGEIAFGDCVLNLDRGELIKAGEHVRLTAGELALLKALAQNPGAPVSRTALADMTSAALERSVDVQMTRLRRKIEADPRNPVHLQTIRGVGYTLMVG